MTENNLVSYRDDALYLTPFLESNDAEGAKAAARVTEALPGFDDPDEFESYSGFITVDSDTDSHMFFWFFLAEVCSIGQGYSYLETTSAMNRKIN